MAVPHLALQSATLKLLGKTDVDHRIGRGRHYFSEALMKQFPSERLRPHEIMAVLWSLVGQGLVYIDMEQSAPENWQWRLTDSGRGSLGDQEVNPDDAAGYLARLNAMVPDISKVALMYAEEAVTSYTSRCYLASATMLGVASEAAFLEMGVAFGNWLPKGQGEMFLTLVQNPKQNYIAKFTEFRKRVETKKPQLPAELADGMALTMDSVLDLLRIYRNDAGHPTGKQIAREDAFINLQMFARYVQKMYLLKKFFEEKP